MIIRKYFRSLALILCGVVSGSAAVAQDVIVYTENYPPFNYLDEKGEVAGLATANVRQVLDAAGLTYEIRLVPWARAVQSAMTQNNALIYTITRTPAREKSFHWLVPFAPTNFHIFMRANDGRKVTKEALRAGKFIGSCVANDLSCELLEWVGIPKDKIIPIAKQLSGDFRMVIVGRADIYISELAVNNHLRALEGYDVSSTKPVMKLDVKSGFYLASGPKVSPEIRGQIRKAYGALLDSGAYKMLDFEAME